MSFRNTKPLVGLGAEGEHDAADHESGGDASLAAYYARLSDALAGHVGGYPVGNYLAPFGATRSQAAFGNGSLQTSPLWLPRPVSVDRIGAEIVTGGSVGSLSRLGLYADDGNGFPGALIVDAGTVSSETSGWKEIAIAESLPAGWIWTAFVTQGNPSTLPVIRYHAQSHFGYSYSTSAALVAQHVARSGSNITGALPATGATFTGTSGASAVMGVRIA